MSEENEMGNIIQAVLKQSFKFYSKKYHRAKIT